jgi:hypothetical protein
MLARDLTYLGSAEHGSEDMQHIGHVIEELVAKECRCYSRSCVLRVCVLLKANHVLMGMLVPAVHAAHHCCRVSCLTGEVAELQASLSACNADLHRCQAANSSLDGQLRHWRATAANLQANLVNATQTEDAATEAETALQCALNAAHGRAEGLKHERDVLVAEQDRWLQAAQAGAAESASLRVQLERTEALCAGQV